ncbi:MAG: hypothetical protein MUE72_06425 [Chitinophagaceae bacterium]|nr:hypothetical protein [Chitinophagaceae bacterium]
MSNQFNHIDQWLQQSAEKGNVPLEEVHWLQMKQLLQEKKKRRAFIWWWLGIIFITSLISFYIFQNNTVHVNKSNTVVKNSYSKKTTLKDVDTTLLLERLSTTENRNLKQNTNVQLKEKKQQLNTSKKNITVNNEKLFDKYASLDSITKLSSSKKKQKFQKKKILPLTNQTIQNEDYFFVKRYYSIDKAKIIDSHLLVQSKTKNKLVGNTVDSTNEVYFNVFKKKDLLPVVLKKLQSNFILKDSFSTALVFRKDSLQKLLPPKNQATKKRWSLAMGYFTGNLPLENKGIYGEIGYTLPIYKRLSVQLSTSIFQFSTNEQQNFKNIESISPILGTTLLAVTINEQSFAMSKGLVVQPQLSFLYQINKIHLQIGLAQSNVINAANNTVQINDTVITYTQPLPANIRVGNYSYNNTMFNGKKSVTMSTSVQYNLGKNMFIAVGYNFQLSSNTVEGIIDTKKKRNQFLLQYGIRL